MTRRVLLLAVIVAALWFGWRWLFPNDETQITSVLERISEGVGGSEGGDGRGGGIDAIARAASLRSEFAPDVTVDAGPPFERITGRDALIGAAARVNGTTRGLEIRFPDVTITVAPDRRSAIVIATAEARFDDPAGGRSFDARELEIRFTRLEGEWVIAAVTLMQPLQRLP